MNEHTFDEDLDPTYINGCKLQNVIEQFPNFMTFSYDKNGSGKMFISFSQSTNPKTSKVNKIMIGLSHKTIDSYIYTLESIKQELELLRMNFQEENTGD